MTDSLERKIEFEPAFDLRDPDPARNRGCHGVDMRFTVKGPKGAVHFLLYTNWQLQSVPQTVRDGDHFLCRPMPADVGYHSPAAMYEGQEAMLESCPLLDGKPCFYDGSALRAEDVYQRLLTRGDAGVWEALESEYACLFEHGGRHRHECLCASSSAGMGRYAS